jgi:hypothetical protein
MTRLHRERLAEDKGASFFTTEIGQPLPREPTFAADNQILLIGSKESQKCFRRRW